MRHIDNSLHKLLRYILYLAAICIFAIVIMPTFCLEDASVLADPGEDKVVTANQVDDVNLYKALCLSYGQTPILTELRTNMFLDASHTTPLLTSSKYVGQSGVLDLAYLLSLVDAERTDPVDFEGLAYFDMSDIKVLDISGTKISFNRTFLSALPNLEKIYLNDVTFSSSPRAVLGGISNKITYIEMKNAGVSELDLSYIQTPNTVYVNLEGNDFESLNDIKVGTVVEGGTFLNINLLNCDKLNATINAAGNALFEFGPALNARGRYTSAEPIKYFSFGDMSAFGYDDGIVFAIYSGTERIDVYSENTDITLPVGNYKGYFETNSGEKIGDKEYDIAFIPDSPKAVIVWQGKEYEEYKDKINGRPTIRVLDTDGKEIYYMIGTGDWQKLDGDTIYANHSGAFNVQIKVVENGVDSDPYIIHLTTSINGTIPDTLLFVILLLVFVLFVFGLVPLIKWVMKRRG